MENRSTNTSDNSGKEEIGNTFLVYWCDEGLESVVDITEYLAQANEFEKEFVWELLKDPNNPPVNYARNRINQMTSHMSLRAQANSQRSYELYCLHTTSDITKQELEGYFDASPQTAADLVRGRGTRLFGDPAGKRKQVIL